MRNYIIVFMAFLLLPFCSKAARVDTLTIASKALGTTTKCVVIFPNGYDLDSVDRFPVVYLLHGYSGDYANWVARVPQIKDYADKYQLIIVCPDGKNSWYIDSKDVPNSNYESYVAEELPRFIDSSYRTHSNKNFRAICGLSMGGHGALFLAIRHQDVFGAAGSMSGVLDLVPGKNKYGIEKMIGDTSSAAIANYSFLQLSEKIKITFPLIIDCGVHDPFIDVNRHTHETLLAENIPHTYIERDGTHNWDYWRNAIEYHLLFLKKVFEKNSVSQ